MMEKIKHFFKRTEHSARSNLTLAVVLLMTVVLLVGVFLPLFGVSYSLSLNSAFFDNDKELFSSSSNVADASFFDFLSFKRIDDFKLFGTKIKDIEIIGINIYDLITSPMPDFSGLQKTNEVINSGVLEFLVNEPFTGFCTEYLGSFGKGLVDVAAGIYDLANKSADIINEVTGFLEDLKSASQDIQATINAVNRTITVIDIVLLVIILLPIAAAVLLAIGKGPKLLPAILLSAFSVIFILIGVACLIVNISISGMLASTGENLKSMIQEWMVNTVPVLNGIISAIGIEDNLYIDLSCKINCGAGYWIITSSAVASTVMAYIIPKLKKKETEEKGL